MEIRKTSIEGLLLIEPKVFPDRRGFFFESYSKRKLEPFLGNKEFVQDNHSKSVKGTLRGIHFQAVRPQDKIVRVISGSMLDLAVDLRPSSPTFGKWELFTLSAENKIELFVPAGFGHAFLVLSDTAEMCYKCSDYYFPEHERGIKWDDPDLNITWPEKNPILSEKDSKHPTLKDIDFSSYCPEKGFMANSVA